MIYEFAVDPAEVASWANRENYKHVYDSFGIGTLRIVCRLPKNWRKMAWDAFGEGTPEDRARVEELIEMMSERMITRNTEVIDWKEIWSQSIFDEHDRSNFHAIITEVNDAARPEVLTYNDLDVLNERWHLDVRGLLTRYAAGFAECFGPMLRNAKEIRFADAHLRPGELRYQAVSRVLFCEIVAHRPPDGLKFKFFGRCRSLATIGDFC